MCDLLDCVRAGNPCTTRGRQQPGCSRVYVRIASLASSAQSLRVDSHPTSAERDVQIRMSHHVLVPLGLLPEPEAITKQAPLQVTTSTTACLGRPDLRPMWCSSGKRFPSSHPSRNRYRPMGIRNSHRETPVGGVRVTT